MSTTELSEPPPIIADIVTPLNAEPVAVQQRIQAIDVLRGFAVLGILLLNIQSFSMPAATYINPTAYGSLAGADYAIWWSTHVLAEQKFMSIFSMLFGAGVVLMTRSCEVRTGGSAVVHYSRMLWLILFGLLHAHLLWYGDILFSYGMCGLLLWPLRNWSAKVLIPLGLALIFAGFIPSILLGLSLPYWPELYLAELQNEWRPGAEVIQEELDAYRGSWLDQVPARSIDAIVMQTFGFLFVVFWRAGGLMLIGMGLYKLGFFAAKWSMLTYGLIALVGLSVGISLSAYGVHWNNVRNWSAESSVFFGSQWNYWGSLPTAIGLASLVLMICKTPISRWLSPLSAVGRMALSNYLLHTLLCTTIFYGHGLGYYGFLSRTEQLMVVFGIWALQLIVSPIWLRTFRFGPVEWLWRSLTYWQRQPMRVRAWEKS